jgi:hypothetical protein
MRISLVEKPGDQDDYEVVWKWEDKADAPELRTNPATPASIPTDEQKGGAK